MPRPRACTAAPAWPGDLQAHRRIDGRPHRRVPETGAAPISGSKSRCCPVHGDMPAQDASHTGMRVMLLSNDPRLRMRLSMLLPNWGMRLTAVETTRGSAGPPPRGANQGPADRIRMVVADIAGMRNTAIALRRRPGAPRDLARSGCLARTATRPRPACASARPCSAATRGTTTCASPLPRRGGEGGPRGWNRRRCRQRFRSRSAPHARPAGRGQPVNLHGRPAPARRARHRPRHREQRRGGAADGCRLRERPGADGLPDAGDGRLHRHPARWREVERPATAATCRSSP